MDRSFFHIKKSHYRLINHRNERYSKEIKTLTQFNYPSLSSQHCSFTFTYILKFSVVHLTFPVAYLTFPILSSVLDILISVFDILSSVFDILSSVFDILSSVFTCLFSGVSNYYHFIFCHLQSTSSMKSSDSNKSPLVVDEDGNVKIQA